MGTAFTARQSWMAYEPRPPEAPQTRTRSPGFTPEYPFNIRYAVKSFSP